MSIFSGIMVFVLVWWMVFFCALPFRIENITKPRDGNMPGAPVDPHLKGKAIIATLIAIVVWLVIYGLIKANLISFHDIAQRMSV
jgi:predicted secreted protein